MQRRFNPFKVPAGYPNITHLVYVDDVVIFSSGLKSSFAIGDECFGGLLCYFRSES